MLALPSVRVIDLVVGVVGADERLRSVEVVGGGGGGGREDDSIDCVSQGVGAITDAPLAMAVVPSCVTAFRNTMKGLLWGVVPSTWHQIPWGWGGHESTTADGEFLRLQTQRACHLTDAPPVAWPQPFVLR